MNIEIIGFIGAALMVVTLAMKTMIPLRAGFHHRQHLSDRVCAVSWNNTDADSARHSLADERLQTLRTGDARAKGAEGQ